MTELSNLEPFVYQLKQRPPLTTTIHNAQYHQNLLKQEYLLKKTEGYVYKYQQPGTVKVAVFKYTTSNQYMTTLESYGKRYRNLRYVKTLGYAYSRQNANTVPLYSFINRYTQKTTSSTEISRLRDCRKRVLGVAYVISDNLQPVYIWQYMTGSTEGYNRVAAVAGPVQDSILSGKGFVKDTNIRGYAFRGRSPGMAPLKLFYNSQKNVYTMAVSASDIRTLTSKNYKFIIDCGYIFPTAKPGTLALNLYETPPNINGAVLSLTTDKVRLAAMFQSLFKLTRIQGYMYKPDVIESY